MYILCVRFAHTQDIVSLFLRLPFFQGSQVCLSLAEEELIWLGLM
jgi:hypothetical protein